MNETVVTKTVEKYDRNSNEWKFVEPTNDEYFNFGSLVYDHKIFIINSRGFEIYFPEQKAWKQFPGPGFRNSDVKIAFLNGTLYAVGLGDKTMFQLQLKMFQPENQTWQLCRSPTLMFDNIALLSYEKKPSQL